MTVRHTLVVLAALLLSALCHADEPPMNPVAQEGARLYEYYCRSCHGEKGAGDGPTAEVLTVSPANLTALAEANDGKFPLERVTRTIDGRDRSPGAWSRNAHLGSGLPGPLQRLQSRRRGPASNFGPRRLFEDPATLS